MAKFGARVRKTGGTSLYLIGCVTGAAANARRACIYEILASNNDSPLLDAMQLYFLARVTDAGTLGSLVTPTALNDLDAAVSSGAPLVTEDGGTLTVDPAGLVDPLANDVEHLAAVHQRNSFRWLMAPNRNLLVPASSGAGIALGVASNLGATTTKDFAATFKYEVL